MKVLFSVPKLWHSKYLLSFCSFFFFAFFSAAIFICNGMHYFLLPNPHPKFVFVHKLYFFYLFTYLCDFFSDPLYTYAPNADSGILSNIRISYSFIFLIKIPKTTDIKLQIVDRISWNWSSVFSTTTTAKKK